MRLTKAEEQAMQHLWELGEGQVPEILKLFGEPKPSRTTVSTIIRILEVKGFVAHRAEGRKHIYYPLVKKEDYSKHQLFGMLKNYFNNSFTSMASFFAKESNLSIQEIESMLEETKEEIRKELKNNS